MLYIQLVRGEYLATSAQHCGLFLGRTAEDAAFAVVEKLHCGVIDPHISAPKEVLEHIARAEEFHGREWELIHEAEADRDFLRLLGVAA